MNPQERGVSDVHSNPKITHNKIIFPTTIPILYLSSPQPAQPKEWDPPSPLIVPHAFPLPSRDTTWVG
jgi:hypothetical protein